MVNNSTLFKTLANKAFSNIAYLEDGATDWQRVFSLSEYASSEYLVSIISYHNAYLLTAQDCSFIIYENNVPVAIWPITLYSVDNVITLQSNCKNIIPPLFRRGTSKKTIKKIYQQCFSLLKTFSLKSNQCIKLSYSPTVDILWQRTFLPVIKDIDYQQYLIADITGSIDDIKKTFRKSYRSLINKGLKLWQCKLHTQMPDTLLAQFRVFHIKTSGKDTRQLTTWKIQQGMINNGEAFCITLHDEEKKLVGMALFNISPLQVSYSVGVYDRSLFDLPLGHVIQLKAIEYMKALGVKRYFLGNRHHLFETHMPTEKENSIGFFKEGFSNEIHIEANAILTFE
jgi:FemAB family protein